MSARRMITSLLLVCAAGCATVARIAPEPGARTAEGDEIVETVQVMNTSWSLLCLLPLASGDVDSPDGVSCSPLRDTVSLTNQVRMIEAEAGRCGASRAVHLVTYEGDEDVFLLLFLRRKMHTSAVLVR